MMTKKRNMRDFDAPQLHGDHPRPVTRRQFVAQGFMTGAAYTVGGSASLFGAPAFGLSGDLDALRATPCNITDGAGKIPFICFDLAGGANIAGSNVLVGQQGGQMDFLNTGGYAKLGLPGDVVPSVADPVTGATDFINTDMGIAFHSDSAFLRGILDKASPAALANTNGAVIPASSENDA